jgi:hypothetical protein
MEENTESNPSEVTAEKQGPSSKLKSFSISSYVLSVGMILYSLYLIKAIVVDGETIIEHEGHISGGELNLAIFVIACSWIVLHLLSILGVRKMQKLKKGGFTLFTVVNIIFVLPFVLAVMIGVTNFMIFGLIGITVGMIIGFAKEKKHMS